MVTIHDDVIVRIEFLVRARWDVSHWDMRAALDASDFTFPRLADIEELDIGFLFRFFWCNSQSIKNLSSVVSRRSSANIVPS